MKSSPFLVAVLLVILPQSLPAAPAPDATGPDSWCGSEASALVISVARHQQFQRRLARQRHAAAAVGWPPEEPFTVYQYEEIAVIEDNGTLVSDPNPFDLTDRAIQFLRRPRGAMSAVRFPPGIKTPLGDRLPLGEDGAIEVEFPPDFQFPFGEAVYRSVFVNSNGDLTFGTRDSSGFETSLTRCLQGPPRIAALFTDLDPSAAVDEGGVYLRFLPQRVRITWFEVPQYGTENRNTVQVTLFANGRATVVFGEVEATSDTVVGVFPGGDRLLDLLDYSQELPFRPQPVAIAEHFSTESEIDNIAIARTFFTYFQDVYDHLLVWLDFPQSLLGGGAFAFEMTVRNDVRGYGEGFWDLTDLFGSPGRLESYVQMGTLSRYPEDPDAPALRTYTTMQLLAHEAGHRWLAKVRYRTPEGELSDGLLGRGMAHWSFHHNTYASVMEGNLLRDNGDGTFTTIGATWGGYSPLDQYLMGLIPSSEVNAFYWVDNVEDPPRDTAPESGVTFSGDRVNVSIDQVIAAVGQRIPPAGVAPNRFRMAFLLLARQGEPPSQASLDKLEGFRRRWSSYFSTATDGHATVGTAIFPN